jgi:hypothetical protein
MNAKLIDMVRMVLQRHAEKISEAEDLMGMADELKRRYGGGPPVAPLAGDSGRQSGGVAIRARDKDGSPGEPDNEAARPGASGAAAA